jgi:phosphonate transport system substrate-binding protein
MRSTIAAVLLALSILPARAEPQRVTFEKKGPLSFGLTGYGGGDNARLDAERLQRVLGAKLGREVVARVLPSTEALAAALASGQVDLAWLTPTAVVAASGKGAVKPLLKAVRHGMPFYRGVLFTKAARKVDGGVKGLAGANIAWVAADSSAGYLFPRALLVQAGLKPAKFFKSETFAGDHFAVCKAVVDGKADVGATFADDRPGAAMQVDGCAQALGAAAAKELKVVAESAPIPNDAIVARPGFDDAELARVVKTFNELGADADGKQLLSGVFNAEGFADVGLEDFVPVKFSLEAAAAK